MRYIPSWAAGSLLLPSTQPVSNCAPRMCSRSAPRQIESAPFSPTYERHQPRGLSPFGSRSFEGLARGLKVATPRLGLLGHQFGPRHGFSQIAPRADFLLVGHEPGDRYAVLEEQRK